MIVLAYENHDARDLSKVLAREVRCEFAICRPAEAPHWWALQQDSVLLGRDTDGCAAVAKHLAERPKGVRAVVLIAPVAPWAERSIDPHWGGMDRTPLGPLEPLRAWADRARGCEACRRKAARLGNDPWGCERCLLLGKPLPLRLVITAHPEAVPCTNCGGSGSRRFNGHWGRPCSVCSGTGRALGPADVARELIGETPIQYGDKANGLFYLRFTTRAEHDREAIRAALRRAMEGL
jgi:hypothetical protein